MRLSTLQAALGSASLLLSAQPAAANLGHRHAHDQYARRHGHGHLHGRQPGEVSDAPKLVRKATCSLPDDPDLVHVPGDDNNGFAMSPDEPCEDGKWCPVACVSGKVMAQWKPHTRYTYPESMYGGIYCNGGKIEKPFDGPYCVDGTGAVKAVNEAGSIVSFCQTVLPGNEAMLIPTDVTSSATLAVPGPEYWAGTSAHYYVNPPGTPASRGCVWGKDSEAIGNWTPFVAGANTVSNGDTFVTIAWNPVYLKTPLAKTTPSYGLKIECPGGGCNGLPCSIDPFKVGSNGVDSPVGITSGDGAAFCTVTVPKGKTANIVVFNTDGSKGSGGGDDTPAESSTEKEPEPSPTPEPSTSTPETTTSTPPTTTSPESSNTTSPTTTTASTTSEAWYGGIFQEQDVQGETSYYSKSSKETSKQTTPAPAETQAPDQAAGAAAPTSSNEGAGGVAAAAEGGSAIAGLVVALVAAAALF